MVPRDDLFGQNSNSGALLSLLSKRIEQRAGIDARREVAAVLRDGSKGSRDTVGVKT